MPKTLDTNDYGTYTAIFSQFAISFSTIALQRHTIVVGGVLLYYIFRALKKPAFLSLMDFLFGLTLLLKQSSFLTVFGNTYSLRLKEISCSPICSLKLTSTNISATQNGILQNSSLRPFVIIFKANMNLKTITNTLIHMVAPVVMALMVLQHHCIKH